MCEVFHCFVVLQGDLLLCVLLSSSSSSLQSFLIHSSAHSFPISLKLIRSSNDVTRGNIVVCAPYFPWPTRMLMLCFHSSCPISSSVLCCICIHAESVYGSPCDSSLRPIMPKRYLSFNHLCHSLHRMTFGRK